MAASWFDHGARIHVYVSKSGDFVSLGKRTEYPFVSGGGGVPAGWNFWVEAGSAADVNLTTAYGRWSCSNASTTDAHNTGKYNIWRDFPVTVGKRYLIQVQAQTMDEKSYAYRWVTWAPNNTSGPYGTSFRSRTPWEQVSLNTYPTSGNTFYRVYLKVNPYWSTNDAIQINWGVQFQNFAIVEMENTYPEPTWNEITCDVASMSTRYGRARFTGRYDVASASLSIHNDDGEFTYNPNPDAEAFRPGRFIKITVSRPGSTYEYPHYYGIIDNVADAYTLDGRAVVNLSCVDTSSLLSNTTVPTAASESTTFKSGARFYGLTQVAGWAQNKVVADQGVFDQQTISANGRTVRDELGLIADSEGGYFYCDRNGTLVYRGRDETIHPSSWKVVQAELAAECPDWLYNVKWEFPGIGGNFATVDHQPAFDVTASLDLAIRVTLRNMRGTGQVFLAKGISWYFRTQSGTGALQALLGSATVTSTAELPYVNGDTVWLRVQRDTSNNIKFYHSNVQSNTVPSVGSMTQLGATIAAAGSIGTNTSPIQIGARSLTGVTEPLRARVHRAWVSTVGGTSVLDLQPSAWDGSAGSQLVSTPNGFLVTMNQTGDNKLLQVDPDTPPTLLRTVDAIPTLSTAPVVDLQALATDWSRDRVVNTVELANQNGSAFQFTDVGSQQRYGPRTYQRLDFLNVNNQPDYLVQRSTDLMEGFTEAILRVNSVDLRPSPDNYNWALSVFLNDLVRVRYTHPRNGWGYSVVSHVQQIEHSFNTRDWQVKLTLDQPEAFNRWDDAADGTGWDQAIWDVSRWDGAVTAQWDRGAKWNDGKSVWGA